MTSLFSFWHKHRFAFGGKPTALVLLVLSGFMLPGDLRAQDTVQVDCETLLGMQLLDFEITALPKGFLDCMEGHPADIAMMRKWSNVLSSERGDDYTVGDMKQILDSVDQATAYRASYDRLMDCRKTWERKLDAQDWPADSARLLGCGQDPKAVHYMGNLIRNGEVEADATLLRLVRTYQQQLPAILESISKESALECPDSLQREFAYGLKAFAEPAAAMACAREHNRPILFVFGGWVQASTIRLTTGLLKDVSLWSRLANETVVMVLYADDGSELDPSKHFVDNRMDTLVHTRGLLAQSLALQTMDIRNPMGMALLDTTGQVIAHHVGSLSKEEMMSLLDQAKP